eukprot:75563_1
MLHTNMSDVSNKMINKIPPWLEFTGNEKPTPIKCGWAHRVRQVLSADTLRIALLKPKHICPLDPAEVIEIALDGIIAPKCQIMEGKSDDPYAYEAREFVRDKILNKNIFYAAWRRSMKRQKFRGDIYYQDDVTKITKSLTNELVANGYAKLKDRQTYLSTIESNRLKQQMSHAMKKKLNVWSGDHKNYTRNIEWISYTSNDQTEFGEKYKNKILHGVVEEVITGSIIKVELLVDKNQNEFKSVIVNIAGINCPKPPLFSSNKKSRNRRRSLNRTTPRLDALFGIKSREWTEDRLLGQSVDVKILHVSNKDIFAQIMHEKGNIAPSLLSKGLAQLEIWTAKLYDSSEQNVLIAARDVAQKQQLNIWITEQRNTHAFTEQIAKVIKVISGDTVEVINEKDKKEICKLSSIRAPRPGHFHISDRYDVGDEYLAYDAKEFVRQKCIGKTVRLVIEYFCVRREKRPFVSIYVKNDNGNEENIAVELIKRGLAELSCGKIHCEDYALLESEFHKAFKNRVGLNAYVKWDKYRNTYVTDYDRRRQKAKETLISDYSITTRDKCGNSLQYKIFSLKAYLINKLIKGVIDSILSGTTLKVYIPLKKAYIAVRLAIIRGCEQGEKYLQQTILQRDIEMQIISHSINNGFKKKKKLYLFNGHIYLNGNNISEDLLTHGFASVVESKINNNNNNVVTKSFYKCEQYAKCNKLGVWQHIHQLYSDTEMNQWQKTSKTGDEIDVMISYVESVIIFWVHDANLISTITTMNHEMENLTFNATIPRVIRVPVGKRVRYAAKYKESYGRVRVIKRSENKSENGKREWVVMFIDYGNKACVPCEHFAVLMSRLGLSRIPALANKCE